MENPPSPHLRSANKHGRYVPRHALLQTANISPQFLCPLVAHWRGKEAGKCTEPHPEAYCILCSKKERVKKKKTMKTHPENLTTKRYSSFSRKHLLQVDKDGNSFLSNFSLSVCLQEWCLQHHKLKTKASLPFVQCVA